MRTLVAMLMVLMVSGDDIVRVDVTGFKGGDVLLPCTCLNRNLDKEFKWQTEGEMLVVVKHIRNTANFSDDYKGRAQLFVSENSSNCSLLLNNITPEDEREYRCIFTEKIDGEDVYNYSYVNLAVYESATGAMGRLAGSSPAPPEPTSPYNIRTLCGVVPVALVAVLSLFLFYKRKVSGRLNAGEGEREPVMSV